MDNQPSFPGRRLIWLTGAVWLAVTLAGTAWMTLYSNTPGAAVAAAAQWPVHSQLQTALTRPTLVMFLHPHCPCSRATLGELALLMAHTAGRAEARAVFIDVKNVDAQWTQTDLWRTASSIPGVTVVRDAGGREARLFAAETSGDTLLFDPAGRLLFQGGITASRGHSGENDGRAAIELLLTGKSSAVARTPVFGCGLLAADANPARPRP